MVKLTITGLIRSTSGRVFRRSEEADEQYLTRITHLYLENKQLDSIGREINLCKNLVVLYLYDNNLTSIPDLSTCKCLSQLFIQNNEISRIQNLDEVTTLTKLYIGRNRIAFVEGLENNFNLQELHVEHQKLTPGEKLLFDPRSFTSISNSLTILNLCGNSLDSVDDFRSWPSFQTLQQLLLSDNNLSDSAQLLSNVLAEKCRFSLQRIELHGNPLCTTDKKFKDPLIVAFPRLESIDGKDVSDTSRQFLISWKASKEAQDKKKENRQIKSHHYPMPMMSSGDHRLSNGSSLHTSTSHKYLTNAAKNRLSPEPNTGTKLII